MSSETTSTDHSHEIHSTRHAARGVTGALLAGTAVASLAACGEMAPPVDPRLPANYMIVNYNKGTSNAAEQIERILNANKYAMGVFVQPGSIPITKNMTGFPEGAVEVTEPIKLGGDHYAYVTQRDNQRRLDVHTFTYDQPITPPTNAAGDPGMPQRTQFATLALSCDSYPIYPTDQSDPTATPEPGAYCVAATNEQVGDTLDGGTVRAGSLTYFGK